MQNRGLDNIYVENFMTEAATNTELLWKPKPWVAAVIAFFLPPLGFLYTAATRLAGLFAVLSILVAILAMFLSGSPTLMQLTTLVFQAIAAAFSFMRAKTTPGLHTRPWYSRLRYLTLIFLGFYAFVIGYRSFLVEPYRLPSTSMEPSIKRGDFVVVQKWGYGHYETLGINLFRKPIRAPLKRGDVVVFDYPFDTAQTYIKRLVGMPGDTVSYKNKLLTINGDAVKQSAAGESISNLQAFKLFEERLGEQTYRVSIAPDSPAFVSTSMVMNFPHADACQYDAIGVSCKVPAGNYFVLGDNRDQSADSRVWGFVPAMNIVGRVISSF